MNRFRPDFLVFTPRVLTSRNMESREAFWTRTDPAAREILRTSPASVFIVRGRLDPAGCEMTESVRMIRDAWGGFSPVPQTAFPRPAPIPFEHLGSK